MNQRAIKTAVIGAGTFGAGLIAQSGNVPAMRVDAVADLNLDMARHALMLAGVESDSIIVCESKSRAREVIESNRRVITTDASILFDQPIDVIVEATGIPETGSINAQQAISLGKHVAMVNKEADASVGPMLKLLADRAGVVYTAVDGDQHGLLIGLVRWARELGLDIVCGGKALDVELIVHENPMQVTRWGDPLRCDKDELIHFSQSDQNSLPAVIADRAAVLGEANGAKPWDLVELTIAANATGLMPDVPQTHCPALWAGEVPMAMCPRELGGIFASSGIVDAVQIIRRVGELTWQGGVFLVVRTGGKWLRDVLVDRNSMYHPDGSTAMIVRPHHLLGIEAIRSIIMAGRMKVPTAAIDYSPRFDVIYKTRTALPAGTEIGDDHDPRLSAMIVPGVSEKDTSPLPAGLARGHRLKQDLLAGTVIKRADVIAPVDSPLWNLRRRQTEHFAGVARE